MEEIIMASSFPHTVLRIPSLGLEPYITSVGSTKTRSPIQKAAAFKALHTT